MLDKNRKQNYNNKSGFIQFWFIAVDTDDDEANIIVIWSTSVAATASNCKGKNARKKLKFYYLMISTSRTCKNLIYESQRKR